MWRQGLPRPRRRCEAVGRDGERDGHGEQSGAQCCCDSEGAGGVHGLAEEGEDIRVHVWPLEDALQAVKDGRIDNAASIIALQWLALNRAEVRGLWS